ncbi:MAG: polysaccharide lyase family 7 protein [Psychroserpens sp.]|uniref:polysaccharide lyase family 7 protein n=1 Tax=Psychroserpens sp. TaxID=2020870 RepID=UPI003C75F3E9
MKINILNLFFCLGFAFLLNCGGDDDSADDAQIVDEVIDDDDTIDNDDDDDDNDDNESSIYASIDFSNWKVTLPIDANNNGSPDEYQPDELMNFGYQTLQAVQPYMYDDVTDKSLVFYTFPNASTANSSFSRTELRELINTSNSRENWTLLEGGEMIGRLKVDSVSQNLSSTDDYHKIIVMQIHGIISQEDMNTFGFSSNNGPPLIKIYWKDGYVWCHKKSLIDESTSGNDLLETSNNTWTDIKVNLGYVGFEPFDFRISASDARIEVQLNEENPFVYEDISLDKWLYENYFKAGNYLTTLDTEAFSYIKYYNLTVTH